MRILKQITKRIGAVILLCFFCAVVAVMVLYQQGYYDISFLERKEPQTHNAVEDTTEYQDDYTKVTQSGDNVSNVYTPDSIIGVAETTAEETTSTQKEETPPPTPAQLLAEIPTTQSLTGWNCTDTIYRENTHKIARVTTAIEFPKTLSYRKKLTYLPTRVPQELGGYWTNYTQKEKMRPLLELYMGYILYDEKSTYSVLNKQGVKIASNYDAGKIVPANARDAQNHALFVMKQKYYYFVDNSNIMVESDYQPDTQSRGLSYDYASWYGTSPYDLYRFKENDRWGYRDSAGTVLIPPQYAKAYEFTASGLAAVVDKDGVLSFINRNGIVILTGTREFYNTNNRYVKGYYALPDTYGKESIGMFHFDSNMVRVRERILDYYYPKYVIEDKDILIKSDGTRFTIPSDYELKGYSDGVLLLYKNGLYGYMNYTGRWIAQPIFTYAEPFQEGLAVLGVTDGKKGMIDSSGNIVIPFVCDYISNASSGVIVGFEESTGWTIYNKLMKNGEGTKE